MIYLLFTNRPNFAKLAVAQFAKLSDITPVVLDNGEGSDEYKDKCEYLHNKEWTSPTEAFNWFRLQKKYQGEDILIMDDDAIMHLDVTPIIKEQFNHFDRVCFSMMGVYDTQTQESGIANWHEANQGFLMALRGNFWHYSIYKGWPEGMIYYYVKLPYHSARVMPKLVCTHLIHGSNIINKSGCFHRLPKDWGIENPYLDEVKKEVELYLK